jgi:hypothetical protein
MKWLKRLFCDHNFRFVRNIYGDEIILAGYKRSWWHCVRCGKWARKDCLFEPAPQKEER